MGIDDRQSNVQYHSLPNASSPNEEYGSSDKTPGHTDAPITHNNSHKSTRFKVAPLLNEWWFYELAGLVVSAGALIATVVILDHFDHREQPTWRYVSLNTLVSWLSTVAKFMVLVPVTRGIGQLKWVWFAEQERSMADLQVFDSASRDALGSLELFLLQKGRHFAVVATLAMMLALGFDPFVQNLIHYELHEKVDLTRRPYVTNTSVYRTNGPPMSITDDGPSALWWLDPVMKSNIYNALLNSDDSQPWSLPQYNCPTGNCTWDPVATLAVRPLCSSFNSFLQKNCTKPFPTSDEGTCNLTTPHNGIYLYWNDYHDQPDLVMNVGTTIPEALALATGQYASDHTFVYHIATLPVVQMMMAQNSDSNFTTMTDGDAISNSSTIYATECSFEICVKSLQPKVINGVYSEETIDYWCESAFQSGNATHSEDLDAWISGDFVKLSLEPTWGPSHGMQPGQQFGINDSPWYTLGSFIQLVFTGTVTTESPALLVEPGSTSSSYANFDIVQSLYYGTISRCLDSADHLICAANNMAAAMTKTFRDSAVISNGVQSGSPTYGQTLVAVSYVHIRWAWLALPALVWILACATWIGTAWKTKKAGLRNWREGILPLLFLYREGKDSEGAQGRVPGVGTTSEDFERAAAGTHVRLISSKTQARLA